MTTGYVLAGYRVASRADRQVWQDACLPGTELVSMSGCVADVLEADPDTGDEWFADAESAARARDQASRPDLRVLGVGIADVDVPALLADLAEGGWDRQADGLPGRLARREHLPGGRSLGFELVGFDSGSWHTWTCLGGLVEDVRRATGVRPGRWGLIEDEHEARRAADWLTESDLGDPKVFFWVAAMLVDVG